MSLLNGNNQPDPVATDALQAALASFKSTPVAGAVVNNPLLSTVAITEDEQPVLTEEEEAEVEAVVDEADEADADTEEEETEVTPFAAEFEANFGMKPDEAVTLVNSLVSLRDEMLLMQEWGVAPADYKSRMEQVRTFYQGLPEADREQFNTPEGAKVIWSHLEKTSPNASSVGKKTARGGNVRPSRQQAPKDLIKRSDILAMDDKTYQANLPRITAAYREGRVLDNQ
jgi:hypothetical protein